MNLFSLRGVLVEKELPKMDLFSIRGVLVEKATGRVDISRMRTLVAQDTRLNASIVGMRVLVAQTQSGYVNIPTDVTGLERFKVLAQAKLTATVDWNHYDISPPTVPADAAADIAEVTISALEQSPYRGSITVNYRRRSINVLAPLKLKPEDFSTVEEVIEHIRSVGYMIDDTDVDVANSTIEEETITLTAAANSYFFYPGSRVIFGLAPVLPDISFAFSSLEIADSIGVVDFSRSSRENFFRIINQVSSIGEIKSTHLNLATPVVEEGESTNTSIRIEPTELIRYQGMADLKYSRLPLSAAFEGKGALHMTNLEAGNLLQQIGKVNAAFGLSLSAVDIEEVKLGEVGDVVLTVRASSLLFEPGTQVTIRRVPSLAQTFTVTELGGFERTPYLSMEETFPVKNLGGFTSA